MNELRLILARWLAHAHMLTVAALTLPLGLGAKTAHGASSDAWPRFRGPNGSGISEARGLPFKFGPSNNLAWRTPVPGGHSSPVVWENRVFLTAYEGSQCRVLCFDR